jgi:transposase, IS30 family
VPDTGHGGDLIIGAGGMSAAGKPIERSTRYVLLFHLPDDHGTHSVETAMRKAIRTLPNELARSVTWGQAMRWPAT